MPTCLARQNRRAFVWSNSKSRISNAHTRKELREEFAEQSAVHLLPHHGAVRGGKMNNTLKQCAAERAARKGSSLPKPGISLSKRTRTDEDLSGGGGGAGKRVHREAASAVAGSCPPSFDETVWAALDSVSKQDILQQRQDEELALSLAQEADGLFDDGGAGGGGTKQHFLQQQQQHQDAELARSLAQEAGGFSGGGSSSGGGGASSSSAAADSVHGPIAEFMSFTGADRCTARDYLDGAASRGLSVEQAVAFYFDSHGRPPPHPRGGGRGGRVVVTGGGGGGIDAAALAGMIGGAGGGGAIAAAIARAKAGTGSHRIEPISSFTNPSKLYLNATNPERGDPCASPPTVAFADVTAGPVLEALTCGFEVDPCFLKAHLPPKCDLLIVGQQGTLDEPKNKGVPQGKCNMRSRRFGCIVEGQGMLGQPLDRVFFTDAPMAINCRGHAADPAFREKLKNGGQKHREADSWNAWGTMHAKLLLLRYPSLLRVLISTGNQIQAEWSEGQISNANWIMDFPLLHSGGGGGAAAAGAAGGGGGSGGATTHPFARSLAEFMRRLFEPVLVGQNERGPCPRSQEIAQRWLHCVEEGEHRGDWPTFDFNGVGDNVSLVASAPGVYWLQETASADIGEGQSMDYGFERVAQLLRRPSPDKPKFEASDAIEMTVGSVGTVNWDWWKYARGSLSAGARKSDEMRVVFCSERRSRGERFGARGIQGAMYNHFQMKTFKPGFPLYGCDAGCTKDHGPYGHSKSMVFDCMPPHDDDASRARAHMVVHAKIFTRSSSVTGRGWVMVGSANFSSPAFGTVSAPSYLKPVKMKRQKISSWELGVLLHNVNVRELAHNQTITWRHPLPESARYERGDVPMHSSSSSSSSSHSSSF